MYIYEVVDATDEETYYTIGIYSTLALALAELAQPEPPETYHCHGDWGYADFDIRRRPIDKYSEYGKSVATVTWKLLPFDDNNDEELWERTVKVKAPTGEGE